MRDGLSKLRIVPLIAPVAAITDNTATVSAIIDTRGYNEVTLAFVTGTNADADATVTALLEESDASNMSGSNAVADDDMVSQTNGTAPETAASYNFADDVETRAIGYVGTKRYIRLTLTPAGNTGNHFVAGVALLGGKVPAVATLAASGS